MEQPANIWAQHAKRIRLENRKKVFWIIADSIGLIAIGFIFGVLFVAIPILTGG